MGFPGNEIVTTVLKSIIWTFVPYNQIVTTRDFEMNISKDFEMNISGIVLYTFESIA